MTHYFFKYERLREALNNTSQKLMRSLPKQQKTIMSKKNNSRNNAFWGVLATLSNTLLVTHYFYLFKFIENYKIMRETH